MNLNQLFSECKGCKACHLRYDAATQVVPWETGDNPEIMFVSEAPGMQEDKTGLPYQGAAGKLFTKMVTALGYKRGEDLHVTNIVKCRPSKNRTPTYDERHVCANKWLLREIFSVNPKIIICLGLASGQFLLDKPDTKMKELHGTIYTKTLMYPNIPGDKLAGTEKRFQIGVTYHPSYIIYNGYSPAVKRLIWNDVTSILDNVGVKYTSRNQRT